ncbi:MAG: precorrin-3B synthase [Hyphomicrobiales bacterium]
MSARAGLRRGWCPSVLRPMPSGDGLLLRLGIPGGAMQAALARQIADCARRFGNGLVDLTRRANLQLRGVCETALPSLVARLASLGLVPPEEEPEAACNIMASPLAGIDPSAVCDIRPMVMALRECLASERALVALPAKFGFLVDDGGEPSLDDVDADIRFKAMFLPSGPRFLVGLGGHADAAVTIGSCAARDLPDAAIALARAFLELRGEEDEAPRRMGNLVGLLGAHAIARSARALIVAAPKQARAPTLSPRERGCFDEVEAGEGTVPLGILPLSLPSLTRGPPSPARGEGKPPIGFRLLDKRLGFLGVAAPFGRLASDQLERLAESAEETRGELRLSPWRAILVTNVTASQSEKLSHRFAGSGFITEASDPRLAVTACPGSPACLRATVSTRDDALLLAPLARSFAAEGIGMHLSGCAKGCARSGATCVTLVGHDGRYDLVLDGTTGDRPRRQGLTAEEAKTALVQIIADRATLAKARAGNLGRIR